MRWEGPVPGEIALRMDDIDTDMNPWEAPAWGTSPEGGPEDCAAVQ